MQSHVGGDFISAPLAFPRSSGVSKLDVHCSKPPVLLPRLPGATSPATRSQKDPNASTPAGTYHSSICHPYSDVKKGAHIFRSPNQPRPTPPVLRCRAPTTNRGHRRTKNSLGHLTPENSEAYFAAASFLTFGAFDRLSLGPGARDNAP